MPATTTYDTTFARNSAKNYERHFVPVIGRPVAERLIEAAELHPGERVLDVACGTGIVTRLAAQRVGAEGSVAGLDPNPAMLSVARDAVPAELGVTWIEAPAEKIPLEDESCDVVLCGMGLQFFSDRAAGLRQMRRVLVPGGRLVANMPGPTPPPLQAMADALARHVSPASAGFVNAVFALHDIEQVHSLAETAGFHSVQVRSAETPLDLGTPGTFLWSYIFSTPLAAAVEKLDENRRSELERDFVQACQRFLSDGTLKGAVRMTTLIAVK